MRSGNLRRAVRHQIGGDPRACIHRTHPCRRQDSTSRPGERRHPKVRLPPAVDLDRCFYLSGHPAGAPLSDCLLIGGSIKGGDIHHLVPQVRRRLTCLSRQQRLTDDRSPVSSVFWTAYGAWGRICRSVSQPGTVWRKFATPFGPDYPLDRTGGSIIDSVAPGSPVVVEQTADA